MIVWFLKLLLLAIVLYAGWCLFCDSDDIDILL